MESIRWILFCSLTCSYISPALLLIDTTDLNDITCSADTTAGIDPSSITYQGPDNNIAHSYLCENFMYMFKCCGRIKQWKLYAAKTGSIQLQVWRRTATRVYELIGENYCLITAAGSVTCNIADNDRISVRKGDFIGWHNQGNETLYYESNGHFDSTKENLFRRQDIGDPYVGDTYDWSEVEAYNDRYYPVQATYEASTNPSISVADIDVPDYLNNGDTVGRFTYSDSDLMDNRSLVVVSTRTSAYYTAHLPSGYITASSLYRPRDDSLAYYLYDLCYKVTSDTRSHSINVQPTALTFDHLDATFTVAEDFTKNQTLLYTIKCTDPVDQWYCSSDWSTTLPFMLKAETNESYGFYLSEYASLDSSTSPLTLTIACVENLVTNSQTSYTGTITLHITDNTPPTLTNLDAAVEVNSETAIRGDSIYNVTYTDPENDIVTFTMTCDTGGSTNTDTFRILANGNVVLRKFLTSTTNYQFDCDITATDTDGQTDVGNLHIAILNIDHVDITNMPPATLQIEENTPIGSYLYTFEYDDTDTVFPDYWSITFDDNNFNRHFNLDPQTGVLTTAFSELNYEATGVAGTTYTMTLTVGDVKGTTSETLNFQIVNQNEPPWFEEDYYTLQIGEGPDGTVVTDGTVFTSTIHDEDTIVAANNEVHRYSLDCDNITTTQKFYMNEDTAEITFEGAYDLDTAGYSNEVTCTVTVTDYYGLSDTTILYIFIVNQNESTPAFTHSTYTFYLATNTPVGTFVGSITAHDYDSSDDYNDEIIYSLDQTALGDKLLAVDNNGGLYLMDTVLDYSHLISSSMLPAIVAQAENAGNGPTGVATINIVIPETTTVTTTTTDRNEDFYEDRWSYFWLMSAIGGIALIIIALSLVLFRICRLTRVKPWCYQCWVRICCRPPPPQPRGFGDRGYDLASFGHRHVYADEDGDIDGWLIKPNKHKKNKRDKDIVEDEHARYGTPNYGYDRTGEIRAEPIYEMFRVPSKSTVPKAANYLSSYTSTKPIPSSSKKTEHKSLMSRR
ncbi:bahd acyltransferase [Mactra antiquata]